MKSCRVLHHLLWEHNSRHPLWPAIRVTHPTRSGDSVYTHPFCQLIRPSGCLHVIAVHKSHIQGFVSALGDDGTYIYLPNATTSICSSSFPHYVNKGYSPIVFFKNYRGHFEIQCKRGLKFFAILGYLNYTERRETMIYDKFSSMVNFVNFLLEMMWGRLSEIFFRKREVHRNVLCQTDRFWVDK